MKLVTVSKDAIRKKVALHFHDAHGTHSPSSSANVRKMYPYDSRSWAELANALNRLPWMAAIGALLSPRDMHKYNTINDLTETIWSSVNKVVAIAVAQPGLELRSITHFDEKPKAKAPRKRAKKVKPASKRTKSTPKKSTPKKTKQKKPALSRSKSQSKSQSKSVRSSKGKNRM
jgi:hypothetical protein